MHPDSQSRQPQDRWTDESTSSLCWVFFSFVCVCVLTGDRGSLSKKVLHVPGVQIRTCLYPLHAAFAVRKMSLFDGPSCHAAHIKECISHDLLSHETCWLSHKSCCINIQIPVRHSRSYNVSC